MQPIHQHILSEDVGKNTIITQVTATDADSMYTPNGVIHYIIKGVENDELFTVNREKGQCDRISQREGHVCVREAHFHVLN